MATLRVLSQNFRKDTIIEPVPSHQWAVRLPVMVGHIKAVAAAVIGAQEATEHQCWDLMNALPNWTFAGGLIAGNVPIMWNTLVMRAEEGTLAEFVFPSGLRERYMTLIRLTHLATGWGGWFGSLHLASGGADEPNPDALRQAQIKAAVQKTAAWIAAHPYPADDKPNLIVCADLNDWNQTGGVRKTAYELGGWKPIRQAPGSPIVGRLQAASVGGNTLRSFNDWASTDSLPHDGRWIDEQFTSGIELDSAALKRTCTDVYPINAADHNGIRADIAGVASPA